MEITKVQLWYAFTLVFLAGCSSAQQNTSLTTSPANVGEEKIISRINGLSSRPSYITEELPFRKEGQTFYSLGQTTAPLDSNVAMLWRIAESDSKALIAKTIQQKMEIIGQFASEGVGMDSDQSRYVATEASQLTTHSIRVSHRYYERVSTIQASGQPLLQIRAFVVTEISEADLKTAILDAVRAGQGKVGLSAEFAAKVSQRWDAVVNDPSPSKEKAPDVAAITKTEDESQ